MAFWTTSEIIYNKHTIDLIAEHGHTMTEEEGFHLFRGLRDIIDHGLGRISGA